MTSTYYGVKPMTSTYYGVKPMPSQLQDVTTADVLQTMPICSLNRSRENDFASATSNWETIGKILRMTSPLEIGPIKSCRVILFACFNEKPETSEDVLKIVHPCRHRTAAKFETKPKQSLKAMCVWAAKLSYFILLNLTYRIQFRSNKVFLQVCAY